MYADEKNSYPVILWANIASSCANMPRQNKLYMADSSSFLLHIGQTLYSINTYTALCAFAMLKPLALSYLYF